jgi:hypothetical protein
MDEYISELISNPFNTCVIGYNVSRTDKRESYFVNVKNGKGSEKLFIKVDEVKQYEELITLANKTRADKKMAAKVARKVKEEEKLRKIEEGIIEEEDHFIEPESDTNGRLLVEEDDGNDDGNDDDKIIEIEGEGCLGSLEDVIKEVEGHEEP